MRGSSSERQRALTALNGARHIWQLKSPAPHGQKRARDAADHVPQEAVGAGPNFNQPGARSRVKTLSDHQFGHRADARPGFGLRRREGRPIVLAEKQPGGRCDSREIERTRLM